MKNRLISILLCFGLCSCNNTGHSAQPMVTVPPVPSQDNPQIAPKVTPQRQITIDLVVLEQTINHNRLGAHLPNGQIYALRSDVVPIDHAIDRYGNDDNSTIGPLLPGEVRLKTYKRPRPIVLRARIGDQLLINLTNLLPTTTQSPLDQAGVQVMGLNWGDSDNAVRIGPGASHTYQYYADNEGVFMLYSPNDKSIPASQLDYGLFGAINVQPPQAEYYRSQVTKADLDLATYRLSTTFVKNLLHSNNGQICQQYMATPQTGLPADVLIRRKPVNRNNQLICPKQTDTTVWQLQFSQDKIAGLEKISEVLIRNDGYIITQTQQPVINYQAIYPQDNLRAGKPILNMLKCTPSGKDCDLVHSDLTAIITGPNADRFPYYINSPSFTENPATPDRRQPYREFTISYHISPKTVQAFEPFQSGPLKKTLAAGEDGFAVNYGIAGIAPEIYANRINKGPMGINEDGVDLLFEEFFLSAWAVGDPAILTDIPANSTSGKRANKALYPDDPSNVYHSYMRDHVKFRVLNTGSVAPHVHHQHAHQWLHTPNSDNGHYLDSQMISPGSTYTLEMTYNGSGNRNQTVGDSIFHCHIYPHFAQGMWSMWRVHDVFEQGTELDQAGIPTQTARALPDGELILGSPIPALVPLPSLGMAPIPAKVALVDNGRRVKVSPSGKDEQGNPVYKNPGFPFFIPGVAGHRAPHPPMDFAWQENDDKTKKLVAPAKATAFRPAGTPMYLDGGLPRHLILDGVVDSEFHSRWDFSKEASHYTAFELPEQGTAVEQAAMAAHAIRTHPSHLPDGLPGNFTLNGLPPAPGAPFAAPEVDDNGNSTFNKRRYKAAVIQTDVVFNKQGWHYPQQRFITLMDDVKATIDGDKAPEPFFFRANTGETIEFWHTNLVPNYYQLDDFQVRTPTDILGQHIHLVKFDVTASDGAANGFNYEDGTFSPDEVRSRIKGINQTGGLHHFDHKTQYIGKQQSRLTPTNFIDTYGYGLGKPPESQNWDGAQTTIQRFDTDPLLNNVGEDRTLRTVFTHDHFGPSTHQQVGLYGALLVEPDGSKWFDAITGTPMPSPQRSDGGPTSWQALIETQDPLESYREFAMAMGDLQLTYTGDSTPSRQAPTSVWFTAANEQYQTALNQGKIPAKLSDAFTAQGAILTKNTKVTTTSADNWLITRNKDQFSVTLNGPNLDIRTLTIEPGWTDFTNAIYPAAYPGGETTYTAAMPPFPTVISDPGGSGNIGSWVTNYRNEPADFRIQSHPPSDKPNATDPAFAYASIERNNKVLNSQPVAGTSVGTSGFKYPQPLLPEGTITGTDPYTPVMRAYANDKIEVRAIVGAVDSLHSFRVQGNNWNAEPSYSNSGYRDVQGMGISEHFEMLFQLPPADAALGARPFIDYLYAPSAGSLGVAKGAWGILRSYQDQVQHLAQLQNNPVAAHATNGFYDIPANATVRKYAVVVSIANNQYQFKINGTPSAQLILRAAAGDWLEVTLTNDTTAKRAAEFNYQGTASDGTTSSASTIQQYSGSGHISLNPMLLAYDSGSNAGLNVGHNPVQTVAPGQSKTYRWYAGNIQQNAKGQRQNIAVEFGGLNLTAADPLLQQSYGFFGALIVEPAGSRWPASQAHQLATTITDQQGQLLFTEIVVLGGVGGNATAKAGTEVRLRVLNNNAGGAGQPTDNTNLITIEGHGWPEEPYVQDSTVIQNNSVTQWMGTQQVTPLESYNLVLPSAGGEEQVKGSYDFYYYPKGPTDKLGTLTVD